MFIINKHWLANFKSKMFENTITSEIWGAELADGANDYDATEVTFQIRERFEEGNVKNIRVFNNGYSLSSENVKKRLLSFPVTKFEYKNGQIGVRGSGTKMTAFRVGYFKSIKSYDEDGRMYKASITLCTDEEGTVPLDSDIVLTKDVFQFEVYSMRVEYEYFDVMPEDFNLRNQGVEFEIEWFKDSDLKFDEDNLKRWLSLRFSQSRNFKIYLEDFSQSDKPMRSLIPKTHFGMLNDEAPVYDYTDLEVLSDSLVVDDVEFEVWYGCRISKMMDKNRHKQMKKLTKGKYQIKKKYVSRTEAPLIVHLNNSDIVTYLDSLTPKEFDATNSWLLYVIRPKTNINNRYATNKSSGYSDEEFGRELREKLKDLIKDKKLKNDYHDKERKRENNEIEQTLDYITDKDNTEIRKDFRTLIGASNKILINRSNWVSFKDDSSNREIDLKNEKAEVAFEFQSSKNNSDTEHLDGIASRINLTQRSDSPYKYFIWVAKKHRHRDELVQLLKGFKWDEDTCLKKVFLMTHEQLTSFDPLKVDEIDILSEVIERV